MSKVCRKVFHDKDFLQIHFLCHSGENPNQCSFCDKAFPQNDLLQSHIQIPIQESSSLVMKNDDKNNVLEMKTYQCLFCPVAFDQKDSLNKHIQSHDEENGTLLVKDNEENASCV